MGMVIADYRRAPATNSFVVRQQNDRIQFEILFWLLGNIGTGHQFDHLLVPPQQEAATFPLSRSYRPFQKFVVMLP